MMLVNIAERKARNFFRGNETDQARNGRSDEEVTSREVKLECRKNFLPICLQASRLACCFGWLTRFGRSPRKTNVYSTPYHNFYKERKPYCIKVLSKKFDLPPVANRGVINT